MTIRVRYIVQSVDGDAPWGPHSVLLGTGWLDDSEVTQRDQLWVLRQVPEHLRQIADQLESGMTTGPDPEVWLDDSPSWRCDRCGSARWVGWRNGPAHHGFTRYAQCVPCGHVQDLPVGEPR
jgi:hypothetical protein